MTHAPDTTHTHGKRVSTPVTAMHPLDPLNEAEITAARRVIEAAGLLTEHVRVAMLLLQEPPKPELAAWKPGDPIPRRVVFTLLDRATIEHTEVVVSLVTEQIESSRTLPTTEAPYGQAAVLMEEFTGVGDIVKASPEWRAAMERRGLGEYIDTAYCSPLAPGYFGREDEQGRRFVRSLVYLTPNEGDSPWAHPVEGMLVRVDLTTQRVIDVFDEGDVPTPMRNGNYGLDAHGPARTTLKPIDITMPEGPSFSVDGNRVRWENWDLHVGFNSREGLVLNNIGWHQGEELRPILTRASVPEMVVPYGDTDETRYWISYFDAGEYLLSRCANSLALGCDCLGVIHYFDGFVNDDHGHAVKIPQVICMHEEDYGIQWKHTNDDGETETRRSRRLVISYFATIGNYDYGFFWYFYLDGAIQFEAKATGIVFPGAGIPGTPNAHNTEISPGIFTPIHQHIFSARLDVAIDGEDNTLHEIEAVQIPMGPDNPYGNAFTWSNTQLTTEQGAQRLANGPMSRVWQVASAHRTNIVGKPTAYWLIPEEKSLLLAQPGSSVYARAAFATKHLWGTQFAEGELYPAGLYPNQSSGWDGLPTWTKADRSLDGEDIVMWHSFGLTHFPRTEDWPVMPVDYSGFWFKPQGFFDQNPTLDLPAESRSSCAMDEDGCCSSGGCGCCGGERCACGSPSCGCGK
ncbi:primary-amine oxidase [Leucobacter chromiireducens]|uniref:Amine oxidase n=1 Tax=Leucobacter chromiireducens subsp. solipictus TaxID=398235 RepID=A0ABS1SIZ0_9MICO|nr:primary-amine oxidase [Leucobacter chromiireducens]MBL3679997.1 primary-amine oxidase [Leucobacter chromiireducens subsp. solipictus]